MLSPLRATWGHSTSDYHCSLTTTFPIIHCPIIPDYHVHLCLIILFSSPHGQVHKSHQQKPQLIGYLDWGRRDKLLDPCWRSLLLRTAPRQEDGWGSKCSSLKLIQIVIRIKAKQSKQTDKSRGWGRKGKPGHGQRSRTRNKGNAVE